MCVSFADVEEALGHLAEDVTADKSSAKLAGVLTARPLALVV